MFTGLALAYGFRAGLFNIGAEGQLFLGGLAAAFVGVKVGGLPWIIAVPTILIAAGLAGAAWAFIPALMKARIGANEVITTMMFSYIGKYFVSFMVLGALSDKSGIPQTAQLPPESMLPRLHTFIPGLMPTRAHVGIFIAFVVFGKPTRRMGHKLDAHTFPEFIGRRYDSKFLQVASAALIFVGMPLYAGAVMLGGYVIHSYRTVVPAFETLGGATWFSWTADHVPLAGQSDWAGIGLTAIACAILLAIGVEAFARRDVGVTISVPAPGLPRALLGVHGPLGRSFGDLLPAALAWGIGLGIYGVLMAAASQSLLDALASSPAMAEIFRNLIPGIDITTAAGFLQLAFAELGFVLIGLAAATFIAARSSDETSGRLELQLATPLTRARWAVASGVAAWLAIALVTVLLAAAVAVGVASVGQDPVTPATGTLVLALYGAALAGIGVAVAGVFRASLAMPVVLAVAIGTFLVDLLAPVLRLPDWVHGLALTAHLGEPMIGTWDGVGVAACLAIAIGGLVIGAWGMGRRDVGA